MQKLGDVLKNRVFDPAGGGQDKFLEDQKRKAKIFSQIDLEVAVAKAEKEGFAKGHTAASQEVPHQMNLALRDLTQAVTTLDKNFHHLSQDVQRQAQSLMALCLQKLFPSLICHKGAKELELFIERQLRSCMDSQVLRIYLHPDVAPGIDEKIKTLAEQEKAFKKCVIVPDAAVKMHACRIEWDKGIAVKDLEKQFDLMTDLFLKNE